MMVSWAAERSWATSLSDKFIRRLFSSEISSDVRDIDGGSAVGRRELCQLDSTLTSTWTHNLGTELTRLGFRCCLTRLKIPRDSIRDTAIPGLERVNSIWMRANCLSSVIKPPSRPRD